MEEKQARRLIDKMGMIYELKVLLDSPEAYERFEKGITDIFSNSHREHVVLPKSRDNPRHTAMGWKRYLESVGMFNQYFGIAETPQRNTREIAKQYDVSENMVNANLNFLFKLLKRNRKEIWYATL